MDQRTLQMIQRGLIAAVSIVLALVLVTAFRGLLQPPGETLPPRTTTSLASEGTDASTTTTSTAETTLASSTSTTAVSGDSVCAEDPPLSDAATLLEVYFPCGNQDLAINGKYVYRTVPPTDLVLTATLSEMVKGLEPEEQSLGFRSPFPPDADGSSLGVTIDTTDQTAYLEFTDRVFPDGVDTPEGSQIFISTLNANVFQFDTIDAVEYRVGGSCDAFWRQLGDKCQKITRAQWEAQLSP
jgi:hypothetical protein